MGGDHLTKYLGRVANDSTEDLALMAKRFEETGKTAEKYQKKNCSRQ
jgi:hypothetical protein